LRTISSDPETIPLNKVSSTEQYNQIVKGEKIIKGILKFSAFVLIILLFFVPWVIFITFHVKVKNTDVSKYKNYNCL
jgi:hypothetical protein